MRLGLSAALAFALATVLTGCAADTSPVASPSTPDDTRVSVLPLARSVDTADRTPAPTTAQSTTAAPTTSTTVAATVEQGSTASRPTATCARPAKPLTTPSGRHLILRPAASRSPAPTIIVMHGYTGTPQAIEKFSELTHLANVDGVAVMYPEGTPTATGGFGWNSGAGLFSTSGTDDVEALSEIIDVAVGTGCVDRQRMVISGESNGAGMALVALCDARLENTFAAAVLVIPAVDDAVLAHCSPSNAVPIGVSVVVGELDQTVGFADGRPPFLPAEQWFETMASAVNHCPPQVPPPNQIDAFVERLDMSGCAACTEMFEIADGTHTWPGSSRGTGGQTPGTFALNRRLVDLALHPDQTCLA
ncbi:MAG TPA: PHB depolymerase family esterase [Ilumatobacteraceae bacterium]